MELLRHQRRWRVARMHARRWAHISTGGVVTARDKGIAFEQRVARVMQSLQCPLQPTQTSMDGGIDHIGRWRLPDMELDVVTQCKHEAKPVGVQYLREFYGVLNLRASPGTLAMFFSSSGFSIYTQRLFLRTTYPTVLCTLSDDDRIVEFLMNDHARALLPKLSVGSSFVHHQHELILTYGDIVLG